MPYKDPEKRRIHSRINAERWRRKHPERYYELAAAWKKDNKDKLKEYSDRHDAKRLSKNPEFRRNYWLLGRYGITAEERDAIVAKQGGLCAICQVVRDGAYRLQMDHDEVSGEIRGALCGNCNRAIGQLRHDVNVVQRAIDYLNKPAEIPGTFIAERRKKKSLTASIGL